MSQNSKTDHSDKGPGAPAEGARNVDPSEGNVDSSERGGGSGREPKGGEGGRTEKSGGINPVQHSE